MLQLAAVILMVVALVPEVLDHHVAVHLELHELPRLRADEFLPVAYLEHGNDVA